MLQMITVRDVLSIALHSEGLNYKQLSTMQICSTTLWTMNNPEVKFGILKILLQFRDHHCNLDF